MRDQHPECLDDYIKNKKNIVTAYESLLRILRCLAYRHGFVQRTPSGLKEKLRDMIAVRDEFAKTFNTSYGSFDASLIYNTDETGIYYDSPPSKVLSEKVKPASVTAKQKHPARLTAVCTIRADGKKLPLLFIVQGQPDGKIEQEELDTYPKGIIYTVQKKAWMDSRVWEFYVRSFLANNISKGFALLVDNLDCHVSPESEAIVSDELGSTLQSLPNNATSVCQPLDVGIMGPL
ncbi:hypothetical protein PC128_g8849 [Phytophthora cactorum]|nr:hypothetical protein PC128_g8849 [Phytophthora cactorum]